MKEKEKEYDIVKRLKYYIVSNMSEVFKVSIDGYLLEMATLVYPYISDNDFFQENHPFNEKGSLTIIIHSLPKSEKWNAYNSQSLKSCLNDNWLSKLSFEQKKRMVTNTSSLIEGLDNTTLHIIRDKPKILEAIRLHYSTPLPENLYGSEMYNGIVEQIPENSQKDKVEKEVHKYKENSEIGAIDADDCVNQHFTSKSKTHNKETNNPIVDQTEIEQLSKEITSIQDYNKLMPFVWKLRLDNTLYEKLKKTLSDSISEKKGKHQQYGGVIRKYAHLFLIYVAEWHKREFGINTDTDALKEIGVSNRYYSIIWNRLPDYKAYVYETDNTFRTQQSMYVLGGLPINYDRANMNILYRKIVQSIKNNEELYIDETENVLNNQAYKQSLLRGGSLHEFIQCILDGSNPFAEADSKREDVKRFMRVITEGINTEFFKCHWLFEFVQAFDNESSDELVMERKLKVCHNSYTKDLNYNQLHNWRVEEIDEIPNFDIIIRFTLNDNNFKEVRILSYYNNFNGQFVALANSDCFIIGNEDIPKKSISKIESRIKYVDNKGNKRNELLVELKYLVSDYLQVYPINDFPLLWSTGKKSGLKSAVIFNDSLSLKNGERPYRISFSQFDDREWLNWYEFGEKCTLNKGNKEEELYCRGNDMKVVFSQNPNILYNKNGTLSYISIDEDGYKTEDNVYLLLGREGFSVYKTNASGYYELLKQDKYTFKFKQGGNNRYTLWEGKNVPLMGCGKVQITVQNFPSKVYDVFFVPNIENDVDNVIQRRSRSGKIIFDKQLRDQIVDKNNFNHDGEYEDVNDYGINMTSYIDFHVGQKNTYLKIPVLRPFNYQILFCNGKPIDFRREDTSRQEETVNWNKQFHLLPFENFSYTIFTLDGKGERKKSIPPFHFCNANKYIWNLPWDDHNKWYDNNKLIDVPEFEQCQYNLFTDSLLNKENFQFKGSHDLRFYYWDLSINNDPIELSNSNDIKTYYERDGIIFQSLNEDLPSSKFYFPIINCKENGLYNKQYTAEDKDDEKFKKLQIKCFEIAEKFNIYFGIFRPLQQIIAPYFNKDQRPVWFFIDYCQYKKMELSKSDYDALYRMSDELLFDWLFLCRRRWLRAITKDGYNNKGLFWFKKVPKQDYRKRHEDNTNEIRNNSKIDLQMKKLVDELFVNNPILKMKSYSEKENYKFIVDNYWKRWDPEEKYNGNANISASKYNKAMLFWNSQIYKERRQFNFTLNSATLY